MKILPILFLFASGAAAGPYPAIPTMAQVKRAVDMPLPRTPVEMAIRAGEHARDFPTVAASSLGISLTGMSSGAGRWTFRGSIAGKKAYWRVAAKTEFEFDDKLRNLVIDAGAATLTLKKRWTHSQSFVLHAANGARIVFEPQSGLPATEFRISDTRFKFSTRSTSTRTMLRGGFIPGAVDKETLAAIGVALAVIRLDPPTRERRAR